MASFEKINYLLRPSKQVERKLIIEALQKLSKGGYFLQDYTYFGLGSVYFADFILFHKYLLIDKMICAENSKIPKRMEFNKPYNFIDLHMKSVTDVIPTLDRDKKYLVWLDYDFILDQEKLNDIRGCLHVLAPGSFLLITVTADPIKLQSYIDPVESKTLDESQKQEKIRTSINEILAPYLGKDINLADLSKKNLPVLYATAIRNYIDSCLSSRTGLKFFQLFNFVYADNMQMFSFGGIIDNENMHERISESRVYDLSFITDEIKPIVISVPPLTIREKNWLEKYVVNNSSNPQELEFELDKDFVETFVKYYRHYPVYYETLV